MAQSAECLFRLLIQLNPNNGDAMFYIINLIIVAFSIFLYVLFRSGIYSYLRLSKVSKTFIRKNRKGFSNYWLYTKLHKEHSLGIMYYLNVIFLFGLMVFSLVTICLGYLEFMQLPIIILSIILAVVEVISSSIATYYDTINEFGVPFVLWQKTKFMRRYSSSLFDYPLPYVILFVLIYNSIYFAYNI